MWVGWTSVKICNEIWKCLLWFSISRSYFLNYAWIHFKHFKCHFWWLARDEPLVVIYVLTAYNTPHAEELDAACSGNSYLLLLQIQNETQQYWSSMIRNFYKYSNALSYHSGLARWYSTKCSTFLNNKTRGTKWRDKSPDPKTETCDAVWQWVSCDDDAVKPVCSGPSSSCFSFLSVQPTT